MLKPMKCEKCGGILVAQTFTEKGKRYVDGLECIDCWSRIVTSTMTSAEYRRILEEYNGSLIK